MNLAGVSILSFEAKPAQFQYWQGIAPILLYGLSASLWMKMKNFFGRHIFASEASTYGNPLN